MKLELRTRPPQEILEHASHGVHKESTRSRVWCAGASISILVILIGSVLLLWIRYHAGQYHPVQADREAASGREVTLHAEAVADYHIFAASIGGNELDPQWKMRVLDAVNDGSGKLETGDYDGAARAFRRAMEDDKNDPYLIKQLGVSLLRAGKTEDSLKVFETAIFLSPLYALAYYEYSRADCASGRLDSLEQHVSLALRFDPKLRDVIAYDPMFRDRCQGSITKALTRS
jgi:tetratricopeptide (TPR) repeat protein